MSRRHLGRSKSSGSISGSFKEPMPEEYALASSILDHYVPPKSDPRPQIPQQLSSTFSIPSVQIPINNSSTLPSTSSSSVTSPKSPLSPNSLRPSFKSATSTPVLVKGNNVAANKKPSEKVIDLLLIAHGCNPEDQEKITNRMFATFDRKDVLKASSDGSVYYIFLREDGTIEKSPFLSKAVDGNPTRCEFVTLIYTPMTSDEANQNPKHMQRFRGLANTHTGRDLEISFKTTQEVLGLMDDSIAPPPIKALAAAMASATQESLNAQDYNRPRGSLDIRRLEQMNEEERVPLDGLRRGSVNTGGNREKMGKMAKITENIKGMFSIKSKKDRFGDPDRWKSAPDLSPNTD